MIAKSFYKEQRPVALGYERLRNNPDMMTAFQRYIAGDPRKQWIIKYANLSRSDFLAVCNFTDQDWKDYNSCKEAEACKEERCILTDIEFNKQISHKGSLTYRLYLDMNLLGDYETK